MTSKIKENNKNILRAGLYVVATPIGNLADITFRAIDTLRDSDLIACEDTRVSKILLDKYGIKTPTTSVHNYNESDRLEFLKSQIDNGKAVAFISDAGTPLVSDPGYKVSSYLRTQGYYVTIVPGASAPISGLVLSGFPTDRFMFIGFVPTKNNEKTGFFNEIKSERATVIFFESPNRIIDTLKTLDEIFKDRKIALVREITKIYEEVKTGTASELIFYFTANPPKGEFVGLISPAEETSDIN
ncbi:MAG: 16S rRNA (cytidine(1402)-2'-O)-methyltransferase, partial [Alphaproteobacteria bacterium]|nr:16S rRNA (cytidine(1402)-2'-O)-methyltransferase [Alphaproteobacteria bacterium]